MRRPLEALTVLLALAACADPKEAADPSDLVDGEEPGWEDEEDEREETAAAPGVQPAAPGEPVPASAEQCRAAAERLVGLGYDAEVAALDDPARRAAAAEQRPAYLASASVRARIDEDVAGCLARGTSAAEAGCVAAARSEADLPACTTGE